MAIGFAGIATGQSSGSGDVAWETISDRNFFIFDGANEFTAYWDDEDPTLVTGDGDIDFAVDMVVMEEAGIYDPNADSVFLSGSFNGWSTTTPMQQDIFTPTDWFLNVPFVAEPINAEQNYKYIVNVDSANNPTVFDLWPDGYERPLLQGGGNRDAFFQGVNNQDAGRAYYDDIETDWVVANGTSIDITFQVDMTNAQTNGTFDPATNEVWWISEQPAFVVTQGWDDSDTMKVLQLTDSNSDMVYEGTLTVNGPSWNGFVYRYMYGVSGSWVQESAGFADYDYRVRFCGMNGVRSFVQPYTAPMDTFIDGNKEAESETSPPGLVDVRDLGLVANKFALEQIYPNPFNPTTNIKFSIPENGLVTLKVYNLLGEEVQTLVSEVMNAGSYVTDFNASRLASGIYFYSIQVNDYTATKKMMLLK